MPVSALGIPFQDSRSGARWRSKASSPLRRAGARRSECPPPTTAARIRCFPWASMSLWDPNFSSSRLPWTNWKLSRMKSWTATSMPLRASESMFARRLRVRWRISSPLRWRRKSSSTRGLSFDPNPYSFHAMNPTMRAIATPRATRSTERVAPGVRMDPHVRGPPGPGVVDRDRVRDRLPAARGVPVRGGLHGDRGGGDRRRRGVGGSRPIVARLVDVVEGEARNDRSPVHEPRLDSGGEEDEVWTGGQVLEPPRPSTDPRAPGIGRVIDGGREGGRGRYAQPRHDRGAAPDVLHPE